MILLKPKMVCVFVSSQNPRWLLAGLPAFLFYLLRTTALENGAKSRLGLQEDRLEHKANKKYGAKWNLVLIQQVRVMVVACMRTCARHMMRTSGCA